MCNVNQIGARSDRPGDRLLTITEVAERVRHKKSWIYKMIGKKEFPEGLRIGRRRFWWQSEVDAAIHWLLRPAGTPPNPIGMSTVQG